MNVKIEISKEYDPAYAVIYTKAVTYEIQRLVELFEKDQGPVTVFQEDRIVVLKPEEIYMIRGLYRRLDTKRAWCWQVYTYSSR